MTTNVEVEIARGIAAFVEILNSKGIDVRKYYNPEEFAVHTSMRRRIKVTKDSFLHICRFLTLSQMIDLSTISKEFMEYYPHIWGIAQHQSYPYSLIPSSDYINIRKNIALDYYYWKLSRWGNNSKFISLSKAEKIMYDMDESMLANYYYGDNSLDNINKTKLMYLAANRDSIFKTENYHHYHDGVMQLKHMKEADNMKAYLQCHIFVSKKDFNDINYYTIKQDIDSRLYGWDPVKNPIEYATKGKWITGEYHDRTEAIFGNTTNNGSFEYEYDEWGVAIRRYRIRPEYC